MPPENLDSLKRENAPLQNCSGAFFICEYSHESKIALPRAATAAAEAAAGKTAAAEKPLPPLPAVDCGAGVKKKCCPSCSCRC